MSEVDPLSRQLLVEFKVDPLRLLVTGSRPCQHTPRPVFGSPGPDGGAGGCRNRQTNAHITETREVCYPWHPWSAILNLRPFGYSSFFRNNLETPDGLSLRPQAGAVHRRRLDGADPHHLSRIARCPAWGQSPALCDGRRRAQRLCRVLHPEPVVSGLPDSYATPLGQEQCPELVRRSRDPLG